MQKVSGLFLALVLLCGGGGTHAAQLNVHVPTHLNPQPLPPGATLNTNSQGSGSGTGKVKVQDLPPPRKFRIESHPGLHGL
jgi:hypothetical protein